MNHDPIGNPDEETTPSDTLDVPKRPWFSFSLRTLLFLLVLSAFIANFYFRAGSLQKSAVQKLKECGAEIIYQHEIGEDFDYEAFEWATVTLKQDEQSAVRKWLREWLGSHHIDRVACVRLIQQTGVAAVPIDNEAFQALYDLNSVKRLQGLVVEADTEEEVEILSKIRHLKYLKFISYHTGSLEPLTRISKLERLEIATGTLEMDWLAELRSIKYLTIRKSAPAPRLAIDISFLAKMKQLETLAIRATEIKGSESLSQLDNLKWLSLEYTDIANIEPLENLDVTYLNLRNTHVSDLSPTKKMPMLQLLDITNTRVLQSDLNALQKNSSSWDRPREIEIIGEGI